MIDGVLGRERHGALEELEPSGDLGRVLITGAAGSVGQALWGRLSRREEETVATDISISSDHDVTSREAVSELFRSVQPDTVFHLAGAKHAPEGETHAYGYTQTNIIGTSNVLGAANWFKKARVIVASTCKACDPETVYGATKLVAERMALEAGHSVARFHNVVESSGNVFEIWREQPVPDPIVVHNAFRRFITMEEAVGLLLFTADRRTAAGRYIVDPTVSMYMPRVAKAVYPDREVTVAPRRRGDRQKEPRVASSETWQGTGIEWPVARIRSPHDPGP